MFDRTCCATGGREEGRDAMVCGKLCSKALDDEWYCRWTKLTEHDATGKTFGYGSPTLLSTHDTDNQNKIKIKMQIHHRN